MSTSRRIALMLAGLGASLFLVGLLYRVSTYDNSRGPTSVIALSDARAMFRASGLHSIVAIARDEWLALSQAILLIACWCVAWPRRMSLRLRPALIAGVVVTAYAAVFGVIVAIPALLILVSGEIGAEAAQDMTLVFAGMGCLWLSTLSLLISPGQAQGGARPPS